MNDHVIRLPGDHISNFLFEGRTYLCLLATGMLLKDHPAFKTKSNQTVQPTKSESNRKFQGNYRLF